MLRRRRDVLHGEAEAGVACAAGQRLEMSLTGIIRRSDNGPLGSVEDVKRHLSDVFPDLQFTFEKEEPLGAAKARAQMSLFLRLWLAVFGRSVRYPRWNGLYEAHGTAVEFQFEARDPVRYIMATSYGMTAGLDQQFDRLSAITGWKVIYPRF